MLSGSALFGGSAFTHSFVELTMEASADKGRMAAAMWIKARDIAGYRTLLVRQI